MNVLLSDFVVRGLVATVLVGASAPLVGSFTVQRGQSLVGDGVGHVAFAGVGLAFLAGVAPLWGALAAAVFAAVVLHVLQRRGLAGDVALAVVFYSGIAAGYLLAARAGSSGTGLLAVLFGSPLTLEWSDVGAVAVLAAVAVGTMMALRERLVALAFDAEAARVAGVNVDGLSLGLTVLAALVVVAGMASVGVLLVGALMVIPVAAAARLARSYARTLVLASAIGACAAAAGIVGSVVLDVAPGPAVVAAAVAGYLLAAAASRRLRRTAG